MADTYYATTEIRFGKTDEGSETTKLKAPGGGTVTLLTKGAEHHTISEGEKVSKSDFSEEDWQALVDAGAVVTSESEVYASPSTKTADVQALAQGRQPGNDTFPEQEEDVDELNKAANEAAASVLGQPVSFDSLTDEERKHIAEVPVGNQAFALAEFRRTQQGKAKDASKSTSSKSPAPAAQKSTT